jgi:hypothetical protein
MRAMEAQVPVCLLCSSVVWMEIMDHCLYQQYKTGTELARPSGRAVHGDHRLPGLTGRTYACNHAVLRW